MANRVTSTLGHEFSTIYVGPKRKKYVVHKALLLNACEFFAKALQGSFQESTTNEVWLKEDEPEGFEVFVHKLYRKDFPPNVKKAETAEKEELSYRALINYYLLATKLLLPVSELVEVLDVLFEVRIKAYGYNPPRKLFPCHVIRSALSRLAYDDPLRRILCDFCAVSFCDSFDRVAEIEWLSEWTMELTAEELLEMLVDTKQFSKGRSAKSNLGGLRDRSGVRFTERYQTGFLSIADPDDDDPDWLLQRG